MIPTCASTTGAATWPTSDAVTWFWLVPQPPTLLTSGVMRSRTTAVSAANLAARALTAATFAAWMSGSVTLRFFFSFFFGSHSSTPCLISW